MNRKLSLFALAVILFNIFYSCDSPKTTESTDTTATSSVDQAQDSAIVSLTVTEATPSQEFPDAILELNTPAESATLKAGKVKFEYNVKNYQLTQQTSDAAEKHCANSEKGQHIHLILNNEPYIAEYTPQFEKDLKEGHYVALSFLSRSYHESLKHYGAYVLRQFTVGEKGMPDVDLTAPHLFYSRPKGEYKGTRETENVLLDFYLVNTELSADGNKVKATINGNEFTLTKWVPYFIKGLPMGESTIKLELLDKDNKPVPGPFNVVERKITLTGDEQNM